ncbi:MAG TPA: DUF2779 domain-containing protein [Steroidobacteraceae bacterium]|nr:DUF2779 domain-containing protein [Steroidobacteraceae bacterium]
MAWLTKSRFTAGLQCVKRLWFEVNQPLTEPRIERLALLQGREFDEAVRGLAPGRTISRDKGMPAAIAETTAVLRAGGAPLLYQPAFRSGDLAVIADILRRRGQSYDLIEVKASTTVKDEHIPDAAFQTLVLRGAGMPVSSVFIGHVDNRFVLKRPGDYAGLAIEENITREVEASLQRIADTASQHLALVATPHVPDIDMGAQCTKPYPCPFIARCTAERGEPPEYPLESLPRGGKLIESLRAEGYEDLRHVPADRLSNENHRRVHAAAVSGVAFFDAAATAELRSLPLPRAYLDFETIGRAVPEILGTRPYEQWPFQWSVHVEDATGSVRHHDYLAIESFGDFSQLAAALVAVIPKTGPVFVYNATFERGVLERLAERLPEHAAALDSVRDRLYDLWPVAKDAYYHRDMQGSWSIKDVLPTIAPELSYEGLDDVREGEAAQLAFLELRKPGGDPVRREQHVKALRAYCSRDTWGLVVLRRFLAGEPLT